MKTRISIISLSILLLAACAPKVVPTAIPTLPPITTDSQPVLPSETPSSEAPAATLQASSGEIEIEIEDFSYLPGTITITAGSTVEWKNRDTATHDVKGVDGSWGSNSLSRDDTFSYTFTQAGTFDYYCSFHPSMKGTVIVVNP